MPAQRAQRKYCRSERQATDRDDATEGVSVSHKQVCEGRLLGVITSPDLAACEQQQAAAAESAAPFE